MTSLGNDKKNKCNSRYKLITVFLIFFSFFYALYLTPSSSKYVLEGLSLAATVVVPSLFPFLIFTDAIIFYFTCDKNGIFAKLYKKIFKLPEESMSAFIVGSICGFPTGAKASISLLDSKKITREECERLMILSNNAGPAFLIGGIGYGMHNSLAFGIAIYLSALFSSYILGYILSFRKKDISNCTVRENDSAIFNSTFSLSASIRNAAMISIQLSSCIIFFSIISGFVINFFKESYTSALILSFLEITTANKAISSLEISKLLMLMFSSFSTAFGGLSFFIQTKSIALNYNVSLLKYLIGKFLCGLLAMPISVFIFHVIK